MIQHVPYQGHSEEVPHWWDGKGIYLVLAVLALVFLLAL